MKPIFNFDNTIENGLIEEKSSELKEYTAHLQNVTNYNELTFSEASFNECSFNECSIALPLDDSILDTSLELSQKYKNLKYIFVLGIGGSNLGFQAVFNAFRGKLNLLKYPKVIFLDAISNSFLNQVDKSINNENLEIEEFVIFCISKSGRTTETIVNLNLLIQILQNNFSLNDINQRTIFITEKDSKLWNKGEQKLIIPKNIGGRYSVFSYVGITPLVFIFKDKVSELISGARVAIQDCTSFELNPALRSAVITYLFFKNNIKINNNFFFNPDLEYVGKWIRQLIGESLGKEKDENGKTVNTGITPIVSIGSTDLHSMAQLYIGGPNDKLTNFIFVNEEKNNKITEIPITKNLVPNMEGKTVFDINKAIYLGVKKAYKNKERPFNEIIFQKLDFFNIGYFLQFKMIEVMYLARLMNLNAFDQPNVEDYKKETRKLMKG